MRTVTSIDTNLFTGHYNDHSTNMRIPGYTQDLWQLTADSSNCHLTTDYTIFPNIFKLQLEDQLQDY